MKVVGTSTLGFPRMGPKRELKMALEKYWKGASTQEDLMQVLYEVEKQAWDMQASVGKQHRVTVGDSYLYDGILSWSEYLGIVPKRHLHMKAGMDRLFAMARGVDGATALSMKKWVTSNYHYLVPESAGSDEKIKPDFGPFLQDVRRGIEHLGVSVATPVVVGPVTMVYLTKIAGFAAGFETEERRQLLIEQVLPAYKKLLCEDLPKMGTTEVQIHEAALVMEDPNLLALFQAAYPAILPTEGSNMKINMVGSFMGDVGETHFKWFTSVPEFDIVSLDFTRGDNLKLLQNHGFPATKTLGAGLIDSRSVWKVDPSKVKSQLKQLASLVKMIRIQPSGSLQYLPWTLECEAEILKHSAGKVLSFAKETLSEINAVAQACTDPTALDGLEQQWAQYRAQVAVSSTIKDRVVALKESDFARAERFEVRRPKQLKGSPLLPTTTIGSFPQTKEVRRLRTKLRKGEMTQGQYENAIDQQIALCIGIQEAIGLDILVHGEPERTDMVEFFAQKMEGMLFSTNGWVQSFGSRCVRPPIIWADIVRPKAMTVREFRVAQNLTAKPVKGMLTGPVTILNWSFPRADISRKEQAFQLGLCIQDEITDLEAAGCTVIQVDEPALREGMPLRAGKKEEYLDWAVNSFRLATAKAVSETQIHTHMCYCEFQDCMEAIDKLDTDVNSIENARNDNATLLAFKEIGYTKDLGPGTYDIHSPVVPPTAFIYEKLKTFLKAMDPKHLVVNPDCGLKTRGWPETIAALKNMMEATEMVRAELTAGAN